MKYLSVLLVAAVIVGGNAFASGQSHESSGSAHSGHGTEVMTRDAPAHPAMAFEALDTNNDGKLSTAELAAHPMAAHASMVDADKSGALDRREFEALNKM